MTRPPAANTSFFTALARGAKEMPTTLYFRNDGRSSVVALFFWTTPSPFSGVRPHLQSKVTDPPIVIPATLSSCGQRRHAYWLLPMLKFLPPRQFLNNSSIPARECS